MGGTFSANIHRLLCCSSSSGGAASRGGSPSCLECGLQVNTFLLSRCPSPNNTNYPPKPIIIWKRGEATLSFILDCRLFLPLLIIMIMIIWQNSSCLASLGEQRDTLQSPCFTFFFCLLGRAKASKQRWIEYDARLAVWLSVCPSINKQQQPELQLIIVIWWMSSGFSYCPFLNTIPIILLWYLTRWPTQTLTP